jgi:hypothetical protein
MGMSLGAPTGHGIPVADGVEVRASLTRYGGRDVAHLRTWFRGQDGRWRPTRRGVTVAPQQLIALEELVRKMREAYDARNLGPAGAGEGLTT